MSNAKCATEEQEVKTTPESYPAISFFIVYKECESCSEDTLFAALHNEDMEPEITPIRVRGQQPTEADLETAARQLFNVIKDHNNQSVQQMLDISNTYCCENAERSSSDSQLDHDDGTQAQTNHFPIVPCCLVCVNQREFCERLTISADKLVSDGMKPYLAERVVCDTACFSSTNDVARTIKNIEQIMIMFQHALHPGYVFS